MTSTIIFDTAATHNFIRNHLITQARLQLHPWLQPNVSFFNSLKVKYDKTCEINIKFDRTPHKTFSTLFYVIDSPEKIAILGNKWMEETNTIIYNKSKTILIDKNELKWDHMNKYEKEKDHIKIEGEVFQLIDQVSGTSDKLKVIGSTHEIPFKDENTIFYTKEFPVPLAIRANTNTHLKELSKLGILSFPTSPQ